MPAENDQLFQGTRLRLARIFHGLTLAELGGQVSVTRQYMQRLEADPTASPTEDLIAALAELLHVESSFFFEPLKAELQEEICHFRKLKTTPMHVRKRAVAYGTFFNAIVSYLDSKFDLPPVNILVANAETRNDLERAAEKCRRSWGLGLDTPIHNMIRTLERAGVVVTTFEGVSANIDAFSYIHSRPIVVRNTAKVSRSRARFDMAHELGHLVLHQGIEADGPYLEGQANQFASAFLLPRTAFLREFPKYRIDWVELLQMKIRWGVSIQAIIRRAYELGLIGAVQYRNAHVYISRNGWKTSEPGEESIPAESPEIIPTAFQLLAEQGIASEDIARELDISPFIMEKFAIPS